MLWQTTTVFHTSSGSSCTLLEVPESLWRISASSCDTPARLLMVPAGRWRKSANWRNSASPQPRSSFQPLGGSSHFLSGNLQLASWGSSQEFGRPDYAWRNEPVSWNPKSAIGRPPSHQVDERYMHCYIYCWYEMIIHAFQVISVIIVPSWNFQRVSFHWSLSGFVIGQKFRVRL